MIYDLIRKLDFSIRLECQFTRTSILLFLNDIVLVGLLGFLNYVTQLYEYIEKKIFCTVKPGSQYSHSLPDHYEFMKGKSF